MRVLSDGGLVFENAIERDQFYDEQSARQQRVWDGKESDPVREHESERRKLKFKYETIGEFQIDPTAPKPWLFKGLIAFNETSTWIGPPGTLKSSVMAQMAVHNATGRDWHGYKSTGVHCPGVFYFALEKADLVKRRIMAQCLQLGMSQEQADKVPIGVCSDVVDLTSQSSVKDVVDVVQHFEFNANGGAPVGIVIFDTFAKLIAAGGGDEDKAAWQGKVFTNLQIIKNKIGGPHVALVGHTGKDEARGARGSNAILGDADVMIQISGDHVKTATVTKANDQAERDIFSFTGETYEFGKDEDGEPVTVNIISSEEATKRQPVAREPKLTANEKTVFGILHDAGRSGLSLEEWNAAARDTGIGVKRKATLNDIHRSLKSKGLVQEYSGRWSVNHSG